MATLAEIRANYPEPTLTMEMLKRGLTDDEIARLEAEEMLWINIINGQVTIGYH
jgi:hypothetical protein